MIVSIMDFDVLGIKHDSEAFKQARDSMTKSIN